MTNDDFCWKQLLLEEEFYFFQGWAEKHPLGSKLGAAAKQVCKAFVSEISTKENKSKMERYLVWKRSVSLWIKSWLEACYPHILLCDESITSPFT